VGNTSFASLGCGLYSSYSSYRSHIWMGNVQSWFYLKHIRCTQWAMTLMSNRL